MKTIVLALCLVPFLLFAQSGRVILNFNPDWQFANQEDLDANDLPTQPGYTFEKWQNVTLPHTAKIEPLVIKKPWEGISWYKKDFDARPDWENKKVYITFEAVMQTVEVWLNGKLLATHYGGYTPFTIDITQSIDFQKPNRILVKADNRDHPEIPPGKPISQLDFCYYSGIYRNVTLTVKSPLHITDAVFENRPTSGGMRIWFPEVSKESATVSVATHIRNEYKESKDFSLTYKLFSHLGEEIAKASSETHTLDAGKDVIVLQNIELENPFLWHPDQPYLYKLEVSVNNEKTLTDNMTSRFGVRKFEIEDNKLLINDEPLLLIGTNRHQEYPYIGNALSDNAQYRDAVKIREAGFNLVRLSHYPHSTAFMDACDELGLLTINAIPGWQFIGNEAFMQRSYQDARDLIRRDRNHASVVFWELSLNESAMPDAFMEEMNHIAREESPESKLLTCGWIDRYYDVFIPARQHAKFPDYWKNYTGSIPLFTAEYGDWEYFAQDAGLNQMGYAGLKRDERSSRQLRGDGEKRLLQQALNFQEAHTDNLKNPHLGDANWLMFDYNRGYSPDIESSGIMDIFRLPKFAYYYYRSQKPPSKHALTLPYEPFVKIASYWNEKSDIKDIRVYSNCEEVELYWNNKLIERQKASSPVFRLSKYKPGQLKAIGYIAGKATAKDIVNTAKKPSKIKVTYDVSKKPLKADGADAIFVYATVLDRKGNVVPNSNADVEFSMLGNGKLIGQNPMKAEAGIATILLQADSISQKITIEAKARGLKTGKTTVKPVK